ncbi:helix-turn-helix domain-containing protein [Pseudodesulfovibrio tunisiensis]|uniref:helix-turn-helix domain-containing protein n=1 Tax=Pseudodesulfovibrio tunisiensis TaxID=463192 RepID=UPI003C7957D6
MLTESGWSQTNLARASQVPQSTISKILNGASKGIHSSTLEKLWPYLYGDQRPHSKKKSGGDRAKG